MAKILSETFRREDGTYGWRRLKVDGDQQEVLAESTQSFPTEHAAERGMERAAEGRRSDFKPLGS